MTDSKTTTKSITSVTELARLLGRSRQAIHRTWLGHEHWPFSRTAPWSADDLAAMEAWGDEWLQDNSACVRAGRTLDDADGFYEHWRYFPPIALPIHAKYPQEPANDEQKFPPILAARLEKDVVAKRRTLSESQVRDYVMGVVYTRARLAILSEILASWLCGKSEREIVARLRCFLFSEFDGGLAAVIEEIQNGYDEAERKASKRSKRECVASA